MSGRREQNRAGAFSAYLRVIALMGADLACIYGIWGFYVIAYWLVSEVGYEPKEYLAFWPIGIIYILLNGGFRLYNGRALHPSLPYSPIEEFRRLVCSSVLLHVAIMSFLGFSRLETEVSRLVLGCSCVSMAVLAQPFRNIVRFLLKRWGIGQIPVVIFGSGTIARMLTRCFSESSYFGVVPVGCFARTKESVGSLPCLGGVGDVLRVSKKLGVRRLVACEDLRIFRMRLPEFATYFTHIEYFPEASAFPISGARPLSVDGLGGVEMINQLQMPAIRFQKLLLDMCLASVSLVLSVPLFVIIPILIKLTSRGPVFYRQHRLGRGGRPFKIWKFRTMYDDANERLERLLAAREDYAEEWRLKRKLAHDPRVTPIGRFLRRTSLDEVPQLFNVFAGEMSLIGPRPIVEDEVVHYGERYEVFARVKPGVTGLWQSQGRSDTDYERRVALDIYYVLNWSIWMDLWICLQTVRTVLSMKGAR